MTAVNRETNVDSPAEANAGETQQFVSFTVDKEEYAVDIMQVREIKGWTDVTVLPNQPSYMRGVLNLRGLIVPIVDLRARFGSGPTEATPIHVVVIVAIGERIVGLLVDKVSDILTVNLSEIREVPDMDARDDQAFLRGLVTAHDRLVALLATERLVNAKALTESAAAA
jgi:purine-binding chemotaxis protein CheW